MLEFIVARLLRVDDGEVAAGDLVVLDGFMTEARRLTDGVGDAVTDEALRVKVLWLLTVAERRRPVVVDGVGLVGDLGVVIDLPFVVVVVEVAGLAAVVVVFFTVLTLGLTVRVVVDALVVVADFNVEDRLKVVDGVVELGDGLGFVFVSSTTIIL